MFRFNRTRSEVQREQILELYYMLYPLIAKDFVHQDDMVKYHANMTETIQSMYEVIAAHEHIVALGAAAPSVVLQTGRAAISASLLKAVPPKFPNPIMLGTAYIIWKYMDATSLDVLSGDNIPLPYDRRIPFSTDVSGVVPVAQPFDPSTLGSLLS